MKNLQWGYYKSGLYVISVAPEERRMLGPYSLLKKMSLHNIMVKLHREKELYDLTEK